MTWWRRILGGSSGRNGRRTDFLAEALDLESRGDFANALTSYRLALREQPDDLGVLQNIAIAFSKTGQPEEAIRTYRRALQLAPDLAGAIEMVSRTPCAVARGVVEVWPLEQPSQGRPGSDSDKS